jgi:glucokinase
MAVVLAGDVGGTKTLLALAEVSAGIVRKECYATTDFPSLEEMVRCFLGSCAQRPAAACFGVAGPVVGDCAYLTNVGWHLSASALAQELAIPRLSLINDFVAIAYGVLSLPPQDLLCLQAGQPIPQAPIAVLGAGTGMGQAYLTWGTQGYQVHPSEGGHVDFAPRNATELAVWQTLWQKYGRVSVEQIVSGQGIVHIYQALGGSAMEPAQIAKAAETGSDPIAVQTMELFASAYGAEAGNLALKLLPYGGLYVAGGIAPQILPWLTTGDRFLQAMHHKGKASKLLQNIPTYIVLNREVGLLGALSQSWQMLH